MRLSFYVLFTALIIHASPARSSDIDMVRFGAAGDGKTDNTEIIQTAIDSCSNTGGGVVFFPPGIYMTGSLFIRDNVTLDLHKCAVLKGIADIDMYPVLPAAGGPRRMSLIHVDSASNVTIMGEGTIDGSADNEVFQMGNNGGPRPFLVLLHESKNVVIKDVNLINAAFWTLQMRENDGVRVDGVRIYSLNNWNNDGIDIDSKNVVISNCRIDCDDDAICFKSSSFDGSMVENVVISNCIIGSNCNFIKFGMSKVGFRNVTITNCVLKPAAESNFRYWKRKIEGLSDSITGISGIALEVVDGGIMDQITISNIVMTGIQTPVFIRLQKGRPNCKECRQRPAGSLRNILISNILATANSRIACSITGVPGSYVENIVIRDMIVNCMGGGTLKDVHRRIPERKDSYPENFMFHEISPETGLRHGDLPAYGMYIRHARNVTLDNVQLNLMQPDHRPAIWLEDAKDITLRGFKASLPLDGQELIIQKKSSAKIIE